MKRLGLRKLVAALLGMSTMFTTPAAGAASGTAFTAVSAATSIAGSCFKHPYTVSVAMSQDTVKATLKVDVTGPLGEYVDTEIEFLNSAAGTLQPLTYYVFLCDGDRLGTYSITTKVDLYDADYVKTAGVGDTVTFTYSAPPASPHVLEVPQALSTAPIVTNVDGGVQRICTYDGRTLKFRLVALPTPSGTVEGKPLTWAFKLDNRRPIKVLQGARDTYTYSREFPFHSGRHQVIVWKNGDRVATLKINVR